MNAHRLLCLLTASLLMLGAAFPAYAADDPVPPVGDAGLEHQATTPLYLPSLDSQQLLTVYEPLTLTYSRHPAETIVRALLSHPGNERVRPLGRGTTLSLTGSDPVAVSCGVCTVDLAPSALQLSTEDLHTVCIALAATLCQQEDIQHVNILVAGQVPPMDVTGCLPLGTVTRQPAQELPALYAQLLARRAPVGQDPAAMPFSAAATLYYPLEKGEGIVPQVRRLSFPGQHPQQLILALMDALAVSPDPQQGVCAMPDLAAMLLSSPEVTDLDSGGRRVTLHFVPDVRQRINAIGTDPACCFAALVHTLTTFVPSLQQVCIRIGDGALTSLHSTQHGSLLFPGGLHVRADYAAYLMARATLWQQEDGVLTPVSASLPYRRVQDPRALLLALRQLPRETAVLPAPLTDADILGLSIQGDTLFIHLSDRYAEVIRTSALDQRTMAYAVVGTMCDALPVRRVRFFFGGRSLPSLGTELVWEGEFLHNPGLLRRDPTGGTP